MPMAHGLTEPVDLSLPRLPHALDRLRIAHLTDPHLAKRDPRADRLIEQLARTRLGLGVLTGDYMLRHLSPEPALDFLRELTRHVRPTLGWFGVFGNHDTAELMDAAQDLPITWLQDRAVALNEVPLELVGLRCTPQHHAPDALGLARSVGQLPTDHDAAEQRLRLVLSHRPDYLPLASDLGADLMLSGHTHGGQVRLPPRRALYNSSDLPLGMSAGLLRHRDTLALISRGLGSTDLYRTPLRFRLFCPPHAPLITLHRGTSPGEHTDDIRRIWPW